MSTEPSSSSSGGKRIALAPEADEVLSSAQPAIGLSIVIPLFNEESNVEPLLAELDRILPGLGLSFEVILIDDGSRDQSWTHIRSSSEKRSWLRAMRFPGNRGQTAAMDAGIRAARGELIAFLDADLQNDPADLGKMLEPILAGRADVVCGWRRDRQDHPVLRTLPSKIANLLIRSAFHLRVHDIGCTLKVFRRFFLTDLHLFGEMHRFILCYAHGMGARIEEVVVHHRPRNAGESKYGLTRTGKVLVDVLTVKLLSSYGSKPAYFFGKIGMVFLLLGGAAFSLVAYRALVLGRAEATPMVFIMLLMFITSLVCFLAGLLAEINIRILHQVGGGQPYRVIEQVGFDRKDPGL